MSLSFVLLFAGQVHAQSADTTRTLQRLAEERQSLTAELDQYRKTMAILQTDGTPAEESPNPAIRKLAVEAVVLKKQLVAVTEQEVTLRQQQIVAAAAEAHAAQSATSPDGTTLQADNAPKSQPLRSQYTVDTRGTTS